MVRCHTRWHTMPEKFLHLSNSWKPTPMNECMNVLHKCIHSTYEYVDNPSINYTPKSRFWKSYVKILTWNCMKPKQNYPTIFSTNNNNLFVIFHLGDRILKVHHKYLSWNLGHRKTHIFGIGNICCVNKSFWFIDMFRPHIKVS